MAVITHWNRRAAPGVQDDQTEVVFLCPAKQCQRLFIVVYQRSPVSMDKVYVIAGMHPFEPVLDPLSPEAVAVSPTFETIYRQSQKAEVQRLDQIAGMGYRKSLEFLIKDFLIARVPGRKEEIARAPLGVCIREFIQDARITSVAERAAWLGNDETHYVRKWPEHDVEDLKLLIRLCASWIEQVLLTEDLERRMPRGR